MTQGVEIQSHERQEKCKIIVDYIAQGYGRTFYQGCRSAGVSEREAYRWQKEDEAFKASVIEARTVAHENLKDKAENNIALSIDRGSLRDSKWFLERAAKDRGYSQRIEQTGPDGAPLHPNAPSNPTPAPTEEEAFAAWAEDQRAAPAGV